MAQARTPTVDAHRRRPRWDSRPLAILVLVASVGTLLAIKFIWARPLIDLHVYVEAGKIFAQRGELYGSSFGRDLGVPLAYTYPPPLAAIMALSEDERIALFT